MEQEIFLVFFIETTLGNVIQREHSWIVLSCVAVLFAAFGVGVPGDHAPIEEKLLFWKQPNERTGDHGSQFQEAGMVHGYPA